MFSNANSFNQPLDSWDVSNVIDMNYIFEGCTAFNRSAYYRQIKCMLQNSIHEV